MSQPTTAADDLQFIRRAVERSAPPDVAAIYFVWAAILGVGMAIADIRPHVTPWYWLTFAPLGLIASAVIGSRAARAAGFADRTGGMQHVLHWTALLVVIATGAIGVARGAISGDVFGQYALLMAAGAYLTAGIHLERRMLVLGAILILAFAAGQFGVAHAGLVGGALFAATGVALGIRALRPRRSPG
jgi:hypothetical protein